LSAASTFSPPTGIAVRGCGREVIRETAEVVAADPAKIGIKVKTISVTHATMYTRFCNVPKNEPNICPNVGWLPDFHEPQAILDVTFNGKNITAVNNSNWPLLNVPSLNKAMDKAERIIDPKARYAAWGKIDDQVPRTAAAIPPMALPQ